MRLAAEFGLIGVLTAAAAWAGRTGVPADTVVPVQGVPAVRIVAGSVHSTEVLLEIAPRERLAAVHVLAADGRYSAAVEQARGLALVGAEPEQLVAAHPDLVFTDPFTRAETQQLLQSCGIRVVRTPDIASLDDVEHSIRAIGAAAGLAVEAAALVARMRDREALLRTAAPARSSWRLLTIDGGYHAFGTGSLVDELLRLAGARNLAAEHGVRAFRRLDAEEVLGWDPDALVVSGDVGSEANELAWMRQDPALARLRCVQQGRVVCVPGALLSSTSHHALEAAALVGRTLDQWGRP